MPYQLPFERTTFPLSNGIIAFEIFCFAKMLPDKLHFRQCMFYKFHSKENEIQATNSIFLVNDDLALDARNLSKIVCSL